MKTLRLFPVLLAAFLTHSALAEEAWTQLLDDKLSKWEIWMGVPHTTVTGLPEGTPQSDDINKGQPLGLGKDHKKVYSVIQEDNQPVLAITGEIYGGLTTLAEHENFHFSCQVKWGEKKWAPRLNAIRDSGFLYHCHGPHGAFWNVWMSSVECQIQEGDMGDLYMLGKPIGDVRAREQAPPPTEPGAKPKPAPAPVWDATQSFCAKPIVRKGTLHEKPNGEWNTVEVYAIGDKSVHMVNGHVVLAIENIRLKDSKEPLTKGKLQIQSEGAEVYYRDIKIRPASEFPAEVAKAANFGAAAK